jgi:hypothetical protein
MFYNQNGLILNKINESNEYDYEFEMSKWKNIVTDIHNSKSKRVIDVEKCFKQIKVIFLHNHDHRNRLKVFKK